MQTPLLLDTHSQLPTDIGSWFSFLCQQELWCAFSPCTSAAMSSVMKARETRPGGSCVIKIHGFTQGSRSKREQIIGDLIQESQLEMLLKAACGQEGLEWPLREPTE